MIQRFSFGKMLPTDSVIVQLPQEQGSVPYFTGDAAKWSYTMVKDDIVYGLGESSRGVNKRGWHYVSHCTDDACHTEEKTSLYGAHNFFIVSGAKQCFGVFIDFAGDVEYDVGFTDIDVLTVVPCEKNYDLYVITGADETDICRQLRGIIGQSYIPPKWAFGFGQSRWGYKTEADVRAVAEGYRSRGIPLDSIYLDIDYMQNFTDFTVNKERFPDLAGLTADMKNQGIRLVPIIDAGIRIDEKDATYTEGVQKGYFCKDANGENFVGAVWPGRVHFADFLRPEVRRWFGDKYKMLLDMGMEGFWNDMNEPAIFYSDKHLQEVFDEIDTFKGQDMDVFAFFHFKDIVNELSNNTQDYASFYHQIGGQTVSHDRVHNLYGFNMTRAAGEAMERLAPGKRILLFSRASCIGAHRSSGIWLGDNCSWWAHLLQNIRQLPGVQMSGFLFTGADLGGFGCDTTEDLLLRWLELGIFTPLMRNHTALGHRMQEAYQFKDTKAFRNIIGIRYGLLPYLYSEYMKAALSDGMYFRPLAFDYRMDEEAKQVEDQLLLGEGLMIAPVYMQNATGRYVYLPESMKMLRLRSMTEYDEEVLPAGHHYVRCALDEALLFIRPGHAVPVAQPAECVDALDENDLTVWGYAPQGTAEYALYQDDGMTTNPSLDKEMRIYRYTEPNACV